MKQNNASSLKETELNTFSSLEFLNIIKNVTSLLFTCGPLTLHTQALKIWDRIKRLKLRCFGKLNFTYHGKLRRCSRLAAVDEILFSPSSTTASLLRRLRDRRQSAAV